MSAKRKISARKILQAVFTLVLTGGCIAAILSASKVQKSEKLKSISLHVRNENKYQFLDKEALLKTIRQKNNLIPNSTTLNHINLKAIEQQVYENPWVAEAQVHIDNQRNMHIYATQHTPAARVFFENGQSFYINDSLKLLPTSEKFTYYTTVVTNVPWFNNDSLNLAARAKIVSLVKTIESDSFWSAQTEQIAMTPDMDFEIYPVLGTHKILFGDTALAARKLENLFGFYKNILNKIGWDKYQVLDARFNDQVVASPALAWKMPAKGFISNMDWVKTIMGNEPKEVSDTKLDMSLVNNYSANVRDTSTVSKTTSATPSKPAANIKPVTVNTTHSAPKTVSPKPSVTSKPSIVTPPHSTIEKPKQPSTAKEKTPTEGIKKQEQPKSNNTEEKKEDTKPKYILN